MTKTTERTIWQLARLADCHDPDSIRSAGASFLRSVEDSCHDYVGNTDADDMTDDCWIGDTAHEIADGCVPIYTHHMWQTFADLAAYEEDPSEYGIGTDDMTRAGMVCLYMIAERLASQLLAEMVEG